MLDPLTAVEIQALRLRLQLFASRQTDATVKSQCHAVDTRLARSFAKSWQILLNNLRIIFFEDFRRPGAFGDCHCCEIATTQAGAPIFQARSAQA
jgi:hypothetical protein